MDSEVDTQETSLEEPLFIVLETDQVTYTRLGNGEKSLAVSFFTDSGDEFKVCNSRNTIWISDLAGHNVSSVKSLTLVMPPGDVLQDPVDFLSSKFIKVHLKQLIEIWVTHEGKRRIPFETCENSRDYSKCFVFDSLSLISAPNFSLTSPGTYFIHLSKTTTSLKMEGLSVSLKIYIYNWSRLEEIIIGKNCGLNAVSLVTDNSSEKNSFKLIMIKKKNSLFLPSSSTREYLLSTNGLTESTFVDEHNKTSKCMKLRFCESDSQEASKSKRENTCYKSCCGED